MTAVIRLSMLLLLGLLMGAPLRAQVREFAPGARYDRSIPTVRQVLGHEPGERITTPEQIALYLRALHQAAPNRTRLIRYGQSWERRELQVLLIGSPERMAKLDEVKAGMKRLASGRATDLEQLVRELPVVVALIHGVHGNEISSGEAALQEAYHLLAAEGDTVVDQIRRELVVIIDPQQNPDGRARFVAHNLLGESLLGAASNPDPDPLAVEHDEPWPGGRSNHYLFDLNRDWFAQTQPETQGRVALLLDWMPQVVVDLHEMGGDSTYYFPPAAPPPNPFRTPAQTAWYEKFGRATARRFDQRGFEYFNREVFDAFYPGYGVSWPTAQGALGMTFEKASARGLAWRRRDGSLLTYLDGAVEHFTAALSTLATAAQNREQLLRDFAEFRRTAGQGPVRAYLLPADQGDPAQLRRLVWILLRNGITVERTEEPLRLEDRLLPVGSYVVPLPQPGGVLARNLLDPQISMNEAFLKEQEERRRRRLPDQIYDVT
ncbi:MAG: M14 family zinc carboxypeptidase, partial [Acidobacteriota bacterium]